MNLTIVLLSTASFIVVAVMTVTGPLIPLVAEQFSESIGATGIIVTAFALPYGALQIVLGPLGDRLGKVRMVGMGVALSTVFVVGCGLAQSLDQLALMRFLCGACMAATIPLSMAYIADEVSFENRQPVIGRYINGLILGQIAGGVLGGIGGEYFDWRQIFFAFAVVCAVIGTLLVVRASREQPNKPAVVMQHTEIIALYAELWREAKSRDVIITGTLEGVFIFGVLAFLGAYLKQTYEVDYATVGLILGAFGLGGLIYAAAVFRIVRVLDERGMIITGGVILGCGYMSLLLVPAWWLSMPVLLVTGFGFYLIHNTMQTRATELSAHARGTAISLWVFMLFVGQGFGVYLFGKIIDRGGYAPVLIIGGIGIIAVALWFARRLKSRSRPA